jgi:uncharacterized membrane protein
VLSFAAIGFLMHAWKVAPTEVLWVADPALRWLLAILMLPVFILFVAAVAKPNPTALGGESALGGQQHGIQRITRHPMLWAFSLWALIHIIGNGDTAAIVFFGAFLVTSLAGMPSIDAKIAARDPQGWARLKATTSILPLGAIIEGHNRFVLEEIGWIPPVVGLVAWAAMLHWHGTLIGVPALAHFG